LAIGQTVAQKLAQQGGSGTASLADVNGDGRAGLVRTVRNALGTVTEIKMLPGKANGTFDAQAMISSESRDGSQTLGQQVFADINGDGLLDSIFNRADVTTNGTRVYLAQTGGGFADTALLSTSWYGNSDMQYGDINGDGKADLLLNLGNSDNKFYAYLGQSNGTFVPKVTAHNFGWGSDGTYALSDITGDGRKELVFSATNGTGKAAFFKATGEVDFTIASVLRDGVQTFGQSTSADVNGDGLLDAIFNRADVTTNGTLVYLAQTGGGFADTALLSTSWYGNSDMQYGDINGDGKADLLLNLTNSDNKFYTYLGQGNGTFVPKVTAHNFGWGSDGSYRLADLDGNDVDELIFEKPDGSVNVATFTTTGTVQGTILNLQNQDIVGTSGADTLTASANRLASLAGGDGADTLTGGIYSDDLAGGRGADTLRGGQGSDAYLFARGDGLDTIDDAGGKHDTLEFGNTIVAKNLVLDLSNSINVSIALSGAEATDKVVLTNYHTKTDKPVEQLVFSADQTRIDLQALVQAVAGFKDANGIVRLSRPEVVLATQPLITINA
jgi:hypothetical protein